MVQMYFPEFKYFWKKTSHSFLYSKTDFDLWKQTFKNIKQQV